MDDVEMALLQTLVDAPDAATGRQQYAAWLAAQGDPRAAVFAALGGDAQDRAALGVGGRLGGWP